VIPCLRGLLETDVTIYIDRGYPAVMFAYAAASLTADVATMMKSLGFSPRSYVIAKGRRRAIHRVRLSRDVVEFLSLIELRKS